MNWVYVTNRRSIRMFPNEAQVRESQIEDVLVASPNSIKHLLGLRDMPGTILECDDSHAKRISVGFVRTCDCAPSHVNCLPAQEWLKVRMDKEAMPRRTRTTRRGDPPLLSGCVENEQPRI